MKINVFVVGPVATNCYVLHEGAECIVIDPGAEPRQILKFIAENNLCVKYIVNTHGHPDHTGANAEIRKVFKDALICIHKDDAEMLTDKQVVLTFLFGTKHGSPPADVLLEEGHQVRAEGLCLKVLHTPGHTPGGISLTAVGIVFTGDTLFYDSIGRSDLPGGNEEVLVEAIRKKLFLLDDDMKVFPGHGPATTIGKEKRENIYVR